VYFSPFRWKSLSRHSLRNRRDSFDMFVPTHWGGGSRCGGRFKCTSAATAICASHFWGNKHTNGIHDEIKTGAVVSSCFSER
jgi:hypothetical protein